MTKLDRTKASVIICVYNRGDQVVACLESLAAMDFADFELVLVDDASTDNTPQRLLEFQRTHPTIDVTIVRNERNRGVSGARNAGVAAAKGDIVLFTDSDCLVEPDWLAAYAKVFDDATVAAASGIVLSPPPKTWAERAYYGTSGLGGSRYRQRRMAGGNMALRRELATRYPFDEALTYYCDDDEMAWRLRTDGHRLAFVAEAVVHHIHPLTLRAYLRQGYRQGRGSARFWYKQGIYVGRDMWAMAAALLTAPLAALGARWWFVPTFFVLLQIAAIAGNEKLLKGKGWIQTLRVLPLCLLYYACKFCGVLRTMFGLLLGGERGIRESKRQWLEH